MANCFTSLRAIATYDWVDFFEHVSRVEQILRSDPADVYAGMDRATRNRYRKVIEELALATGQSELEVARMANALAQAAWAELARRAPAGQRRGPGRCGGVAGAGCAAGRTRGLLPAGRWARGA